MKPNKPESNTMNNQNIEEHVKQIMAGLFATDITNIGDTSSIETIEKWDSLQHVNLIMALEQEFDLRIDVDKAVEMTSFPMVCQTLYHYLGQKG